MKSRKYNIPKNVDSKTISYVSHYPILLSHNSPDLFFTNEKLSNILKFDPELLYYVREFQVSISEKVISELENHLNEYYEDIGYTVNEFAKLLSTLSICWVPSYFVNVIVEVSESEEGITETLVDFDTKNIDKTIH